MSIEKNLQIKEQVECLTMSKAIQSLIVPMSYFDFSNTGISQVILLSSHSSNPFLKAPEFYLHEMEAIELNATVGADACAGDQSPTLKFHDSPKHSIDVNRRFSIKLLPINKEEKQSRFKVPLVIEGNFLYSKKFSSLELEKPSEFEISPCAAGDDQSVLGDEESPQIFRKTQTMPNVIPFSNSPFVHSNSLLKQAIMRKHGTIA